MMGRTELPQVPPVMSRGDQVTYTGPGAEDALALLRVGLRVIEGQARRTAVPVPGHYLQVVEAAERAARANSTTDVRTCADVPTTPIGAQSTSGEYVGVKEAAHLFGVGVRQARRLVQQAGGIKTRKGWQIDSGLLEAEYELRSTA